MFGGRSLAYDTEPNKSKNQFGKSLGHEDACGATFRFTDNVILSHP
jgi:hypothetical protein